MEILAMRLRFQKSKISIEVIYSQSWDRLKQVQE
jgi:hypothetical protein